MNTKTDSREKILTTAVKLFQIKGFNAVGLNEILKESNAPKGSLYYYFPNGKEELALEAIKLASEFIEKKVKTSLDKYSDPIRAFQYNIENIIECLNKEYKLDGISISLLALETHLHNELLREACKDAFSALQNIYADKLIQNGFPKETAEGLGMTIQLMIEGAITLSVTKKDTSPLQEVSKQLSILLKSYI
ncbi:TetR/AcrR family transcriptional regulator [Clostridium oryzae]|uniref:Putative HTH-type transcriptional regulator YxaF n=1 Tax=Clostridium oryzae TaxID=1450648 RepID=A0A1V4IXK7_9CLOT|nr:TetR/AcrR family transcriptional regulator [Clostridium oryzae]OPJ64802.1 putative HTH-type transcriptional regulator YxaF [Clostridium oryzae]